MQNPMSKKEIFRWSHAQEILLKELVGKKIILVDKATSNNSKMRVLGTSYAYTGTLGLGMPFLKKKQVYFGLLPKGGGPDPQS